MKQSRIFWIGISFYILHLVGLLWTTDFNYGFHDLRAKLPILVIPFVLGSIPAITKFEFKLISYAFISAVVTTSILNVMIAKGILQIGFEINNYRDYSFFISHIRFSLMIDFAFFLLIYFMVKDKKKIPYFIPILFWLIYYTYFSQIITGFIYLIILVFVSGLFYAIKSKNRTLKVSVFSFSLALVAVGFTWIVVNIKEFYSIPEEHIEIHEEFTLNGRPYTHNLSNQLRENGKLIFYRICDVELEKEWVKRTEIDIDSTLPGRTVPIRYTLIRYMTGLGFAKDSAGIHELSDQDIHNILLGYTSPLQAKGGIKARIFELLYDFEEWKLDPNPNNKTLFQRLSYWEAGWNIFKTNFIFGVGTGDIQQSFNRYYEKSNSQLLLENRHRSHNQFLSIGVSFGIIGLFVFILFLFYPLFRKSQSIEYLHVIFLVLMCLSFLPEDTLETQSGISFFSLFYGLFVFRKRY
ncbi:MAG: O-antigen ligase family protein [Crocinitomicaceae bacterium]